MTGSGCPCSGGDPARVDVRDEAQHDTKKRSHVGRVGDGYSVSRLVAVSGGTQRVFELWRRFTFCGFVKPPGSERERDVQMGGDKQ